MSGTVRSPPQVDACYWWGSLTGSTSLTCVCTVHCVGHLVDKQARPGRLLPISRRSIEMVQLGRLV